MIKKTFFAEWIYIFKKDLYFICNANIFCIKIYFENDYIYIYIYIFTFSYIFFSVKKVFFSKKIFNIKLFSSCKTIFSANNIYFAKNIYFFKKIIFFQFSFATNEQPYSKSYRTKLIPFSQLTFWKQSIIAEDEVKVNVILANKCMLKAKNFIIPIF